MSFLHNFLHHKSPCCAPAAFAAIGMNASMASMAAMTTNAAIAAGGTMMQARAAYSQQQTAKDQANYQAQVARNNEIINQRRATLERAEGQRQKMLQDRKGKSLIAKQQLAMASQGFDIGSGSNLDLLQDTAEVSAQEALDRKYIHDAKAHGFDEAARQYRAQSNMLRARAANIRPRRAFNKTMLQGLGSYASKWYAQRDDSPVGLFQGNAFRGR